MGFKVGDEVRYVKPLDRRSEIVNKLNDFIIGETYVVRNVDEYLDGTLGIEGSRYFLFKNEVELVKSAKKEKKEILDDVEKAYLANIIKPKAIHDNMVSIEKRKLRKNTFYISINLIDKVVIQLPIFHNKDMYVGMEDDREYTLEELGIDEYLARKEEKVND